MGLTTPIPSPYETPPKWFRFFANPLLNHGFWGEKSLRAFGGWDSKKKASDEMSWKNPQIFMEKSPDVP
jgi:hypothetical protein